VGGDNSHAVFGQKLLTEKASMRWRIVMMQQPILWLPKLEENSSHIFMQSPQKSQYYVELTVWPARKNSL
jgi:hypothetical protein